MTTHLFGINNPERNSMSEIRDNRRFGRRDFLGLSAATVGSVWLAACERTADVLSPGAPNPLFAKGGGGGGTLPRNTLKIPTVQSADGTTLTAAPGTVDMGGGQMSNAWMYNSEFPGPTLLANNGVNVKMTFTNGLSQHS